MVKPDRGVGGDNSTTRQALLDAAQQLMLDEGYAAVSTRRVAGMAGVNSALVSYYFGTMEGLFIELFRRGAERSYELQVEALASEQPLWALWEAIHDQSSTALTLEFVALANHRKAIRDEISRSSQRFRELQLDAVSATLEKHGVDTDEYPPLAVIVLMSGVSRFLRMEEAFDTDMGHASTVALVERFLTKLEGERRTPAAAGAKKRAAAGRKKTRARRGA
jgi:AcrR family transcriptional regulator